MLLVDDLAAGGTKNLRHTPRGLVTLVIKEIIDSESVDFKSAKDTPHEITTTFF